MYQLQIRTVSDQLIGFVCPTLKPLRAKRKRLCGAKSWAIRDSSGIVEGSYPGLVWDYTAPARVLWSMEDVGK